MQEISDEYLEKSIEDKLEFEYIRKVSTVYNGNYTKDIDFVLDSYNHYRKMYNPKIPVYTAKRIALLNLRSYYEENSLMK